MYGLKFLIALLPAVFASPLSRCHDPGVPFYWKVTDLTYNSSETHTFPSHVIARAFLNFNVTNSVTETVTPCTAYSDWAWVYFNGDRWYDCPNVTVKGDYPPEEIVSTRFTFVQATGELNVTQKWTCNYDRTP